MGHVTKLARVTMGVKTTGGVNVVTENAVTIVREASVTRRTEDVNLDVRVATGESYVLLVCLLICSGELLELYAFLIGPFPGGNSWEYCIDSTVKRAKNKTYY